MSEADYVHWVCEERLNELIIRKGNILDRLALLTELQASNDAVAESVMQLAMTRRLIGREYINIHAD